MGRLRLDTSGARAALSRIDAMAPAGRVVRMVGGLVEASGLRAAVGELCSIELLDPHGPSADRTAVQRRIHSCEAHSAGAATSVLPRDLAGRIPAEVVGFREQTLLLMPLTDFSGVCPGDRVWGLHCPLTVPVGEPLLGRVVDGLGAPLDAGGPLLGSGRRPLSGAAPQPLSRLRIGETMTTGIRAIDGLLTCGKGQRMGIFAGSGIGKSVLLGSIARHARADVNVIALIGERGREVREFLERDLAGGLSRSFVVVATSDQPALVRIKGTMLALAVAEYFRDQGRDVLFMMDSLSRVATAQREIGLAAGEPPTTRGFTPSVFALLPRLLERVGITPQGSITGLFAVLVDSDDMNEPISDAARSILDGHIVLSRRLAHRNHYPAIDVLSSVSRVMPEVTSREHRAAADTIRRVLAVHAEAEDVINLGAYVRGSNPKVDEAIDRLADIEEFLRQRPEEASSAEETLAWLETLTQRNDPALDAAPAATPAAMGPSVGRR